MNKVNDQVRANIKNELEELYQAEDGYIRFHHPKSEKFFQYSYGDAFLDLSFPVKGVNFETSKEAAEVEEERENTKEELERIKTIIAKKEYTLESHVEGKDYLCAIPENKGVSFTLKLIEELWGGVSNIQIEKEGFDKGT